MSPEFPPELVPIAVSEEIAMAPSWVAVQDAPRPPFARAKLSVLLVAAKECCATVIGGTIRVARKASTRQAYLTAFEPHAERVVIIGSRLCQH
jgi:hypothetical protein